MRLAMAERPPAVPIIPDRGQMTWGVSASLVAHVVIAIVIMLSWRSATVVAPEPESVAVDLLSSDEFARLEADANARVPAPPAGERAAPEPAPVSALMEARTMLSAAALADPKSRAGREVLAGLNGTEKAVQICNLEAMEQVHAWRSGLRPERIRAYATADVRTAAHEIATDGAAFRSDGLWYRLRYRCQLSPDRARVVGFAFSVGAPIPPTEAAANELLADE